jgi:trehalose 6-phosphate synthase
VADLSVQRPVVIVSNRGPVSFVDDGNGGLTSRRGAGGLVSGILPVVEGTGATWVAAAMSDGDRQAAGQGAVEAEGLSTRLLVLDPETYRLAYDVVDNQTLWFVFHGLFDLPRAPSFGPEFRRAWSAYRSVNLRYAEALADETPSGAVVLVQDFHLALLGRDLAERRPDLVTVHFSHTPFATPEWLRVLPHHVAEELLAGMSAFRACGFHTQRWADDFLACCHDLLALKPRTFVSPLPGDAAALRAEAASDACNAALAELDEVAGDRLVVGRVDRIELSKNIVRGFEAFDDMLERYPQWRERVVFAASVYPSRSGLADYQRYQAEVDAVVERVNDRWATAGWTPIVYDTSDDYPRSVALLRRTDVLLVNPIRDGLNLVAKEGALVNERDGVLCLSPEAGVWSELGDVALPVRPYDVAGTADQLDAALRMPPDARARHAAALRQRAETRGPADWFADQLRAAGSSR